MFGRVYGPRTHFRYSTIFWLNFEEIVGNASQNPGESQFLDSNPLFSAPLGLTIPDNSGKMRYAETQGASLGFGLCLIAVDSWLT